MVRRRAFLPSWVLALLTARSAGFFAAAVLLVHGRPSSLLGLFLGHALFLVSLFDMVRFAFLFFSVFSAWHDSASCRFIKLNNIGRPRSPPAARSRIDKPSLRKNVKFHTILSRLALFE